MRVLLVNKFLYPKGGSETYVFKLGEMLAEKGVAVSEIELRYLIESSVNAFNEGFKKE